MLGCFEKVIVLAMELWQNEAGVQIEYQANVLCMIWSWAKDESKTGLR
jgi:hypothetical protein